MSKKRKSEAVEESAPPPSIRPVIRTCSDCRPFCASWKAEFLCEGGVKYTGGPHMHRIWDCYHQHYCSDSDSDEDESKAEPTEVGAGNDGCTVEQRVALLCCLYKIASKYSKQQPAFRSFADPKFLRRNFKDLIQDQDKTLRLAILFSCNKIQTECHALARNRSVADLEKQVGKLQVYRHPSDESEDDENNSWAGSWGDCPYEVQSVEADEAEHFELSRVQWKLLRNEEGCVGCPLHLSVFTYDDKDSVDVKSVLDSIHIA